MKPSQIKMGVAIFCLIVLLSMMGLFVLSVVAGDEISELKTLNCCIIPMGVAAAIIGLWAWSSANTDRVHEMEIEEIEVKRAKRRAKRKEEK